MPLETAVQACCNRFPPKPGPVYLQAEMHLTLSHHRRIMLNGLCQGALVAAYKASDPDGCVADIAPSVEGESMNRAQPFHICKSTLLIGARGETKGSQTEPS